MNHKFTGKGTILANNSDYEYHLIIIDEQINKELHTLFQNHNKDTASIIESKYGIHPKFILAFGKGSPSKQLLAKFITPIDNHFDDTKGLVKVYPCYCHQETNPKKRLHERMVPVLHDSVETSFNCARERLFYPEYCIILKIEKDGKEINVISETAKEEV